MNTSIGPASVPPAESGDLDALQSAISDGIQALVAWDIAAFESATRRQNEICIRIASNPEPHTLSIEAANKVRDLNRVYDRLLQHSVHWARTIHAILHAGGDAFQNRTSMHFRG